ncbi:MULTISPECIES: SdpI family protein [unclassified Enterococcus]|uniref:SdpI family protein n=1 Tax=unclassified Enterococcus TaxID=2608891 RepID=UPI0013ED2344|nr:MULTISPECIES: SdpI family protein [unclassified Enterococcus]
MLFYSNFILIVAILLLLNIWFFDRSRNAGIGFRTKRSLSSKKIWVYSQTIFYRGIVLISLLSSTLYSLNVIDVSTSNSISIIGIIISAIIVQLFLVFGEKKKVKNRKTSDRFDDRDIKKLEQTE